MIRIEALTRLSRETWLYAIPSRGRLTDTISVEAKVLGLVPYPKFLQGTHVFPVAAETKSMRPNFSSGSQAAVLQTYPLPSSLVLREMR